MVEGVDEIIPDDPLHLLGRGKDWNVAVRRKKCILLLYNCRLAVALP